MQDEALVRYNSADSLSPRQLFALLSFSSSLLIPLGITYTGFLASVVEPDLAYIINNLCVIAIVLLCGACI